MLEYEYSGKQHQKSHYNDNNNAKNDSSWKGFHVDSVRRIHF